jgi:hypothetical protein
VTDDDFDLSKHRVDIPTKPAGSPPKRIAKRRQSFVQVPLVASDILARNVRDKTYPVYHHLLYESWRAGGRPVKVANGFLGMIGIGRKAKNRTLRKLERLNLIRVDWQGKKSPLVTVLNGDTGGTGQSLTAQLTRPTYCNE